MGTPASLRVIVPVAAVLGLTLAADAQEFELNPVELTGTVRVGDYTITSLRVIATSGQLSSSTPTFTPNAMEAAYETIVQVPADGSALYRLRVQAGLQSADGSQFVNFLFEGGSVRVQDGEPATLDMRLDPPSLISATVTANAGELLETVFLQAVNADSGVVGTFSTSLDAPVGGVPELTAELPVGPGIRLQCRGNALMTNGRTAALEPRRIVTVPEGGIDDSCAFDVAPPPLRGSVSGSLDFQGEVPVEAYLLTLSPRPGQPGERQDRTLLPPFAGPGNRAEFRFDDVVEGLYQLGSRTTLDGGNSEYFRQLADTISGTGYEVLAASVCQAYVETSFVFGGLTAPEDYAFDSQVLVLGDLASSRTLADPRDGPLRFVASDGGAWQQRTSFRIASTSIGLLRFEPFPVECFETVTTPTRVIETGRLDIRLRVSDGGFLSLPRVEGSCELPDQAGEDPVYRYNVGSSGSGATVQVGRVFVEAPAGVCDLSASATVGGIRVNFGNLGAFEIEPGADVVIELGAPRIEISTPSAGEVVDAAEIVVIGTATDDGEVVGVAVNGVAANVTPSGNPADPAEVTYMTTVPLQFGQNVIQAVATDDDGNTGIVGVAIDNTLAPADDDPPLIEITSPIPGSRFDGPFIPVAGIATDDVGLASVQIGGSEVTLMPTGNPDDPNEVAFSGQATVFGDGTFTLVAIASDSAGQTTTASVQVEVGPPPLACDVNGDFVVDNADLGLIFAARGSAADGPDDPRDANGDGLITINDGRYCALQCSNPRCAR